MFLFYIVLNASNTDFISVSRFVNNSGEWVRRVKYDSMVTLVGSNR